MQCKEIQTREKSRLWVAVLDAAEEAKAALIALAATHNLRAASFIALGAFERAVVGYFDWERKIYKRLRIDQQVEVITLVGDIVLDSDGRPDLHAHCVLGLPDATTRGGYLLEGHVRPTLEVLLTETPAHLIRRKRADLGIALIDVQ